MSTVIECLEFQKSGMTSKEWDDYIRNAYNGTLFQLQRFLKYHQEKQINDCSLVCRKKEKILALLPAAIKEEQGEKIFSSHFGASWGGIVSSTPLNFEDAEAVSNEILSVAKRMGCQRIEITFPPSIYHKTLTDNIHFILLQKGFSYLKRELTNVISLQDKDDLTSHLDRSVRWGANKSQKMEIEIKRDSNDWQSFYELLRASLQDKRTKPTHSVEELLLLKKIFPGEIELWTAHKGEELVGGLCNWQVQPGIWLIFYSAYLAEMSSFRILNRLYTECLREYQQIGNRYVDFGTSSINMQVNRGLISFKEQFSAWGIFRDTLVFDLKSGK